MESLGLGVELVELLRGEGIFRPTPIQAAVIPRILGGESLIARSQTGSGKTLAYIAPLMQSLGGDDGGSVMLVLLPTRELAQQVGRVVQGLCGAFRVAVIHGGVS